MTTQLTAQQEMINPTKAIYGKFYFLVSDNPEHDLWFYSTLKEAVSSLAYARLIDRIYTYSLLDPFGYIVPSEEIQKVYLRKCLD